MRRTAPHENDNLRQQTKRIKDKQPNRERARKRYERQKAEGTRPKPKPITNEQRLAYNAQKREKAARDRAHAKEATDTQVAEWRIAPGISIVTRNTAQLGRTYWTGPGAAKERRLETQADKILRNAAKREKASAAAEPRKTKPQEAPGQTERTTHDPDHQEKLHRSGSEPQPPKPPFLQRALDVCAAIYLRRLKP